MTRKQERRCAARGCRALVNRSKLMCREHWSKVPTPIKRELTAAYAARGGSPSSPMTQRYADAVVAAVRAVATIDAAQAEAGVALDPETLFAHPDDHNSPVLDLYRDDPPAVEEAVADVPADEGDVCSACAGRGGDEQAEMQGDPPMTGLVYFFEACGACIGSGLCPGCMRATVPDGVRDGDIAIDDFVCSACGWSYDPARGEPDYESEAEAYYDMRHLDYDWRDNPLDH